MSDHVCVCELTLRLRVCTYTVPGPVKRVTKPSPLRKDDVMVVAARPTACIPPLDPSVGRASLRIPQSPVDFCRTLDPAVTVIAWNIVKRQSDS